MAKHSQSMCPNHPDSPVIARCATCNKPVCAQCLFERNGAAYCSVQCAENAERMQYQANSVIESKNRADHNSIARKLIILGILILLAAIGYWYYHNNQEQVQKVVNQAEQKIKSTGNDAKAKAQETKSEIQEKVPGDSKYKKEREESVNK